MRGPAVGVGDGVVDVAIECRMIAAGPAARQIPAPHKIGQLLRRHISALGRGIDRVNQRHQLGIGGQLGDEFGRDEPVSAYLGCRCAAAALERGLLGDHMYHHRRCGGPLSSGAVTAPTATAQSIGPRRERSQRISAALLARAWIALAHRAGQRSEPLVQGMRIGTQQAAVNFGQTAAEVGEPDLAFSASLCALAHRVDVSFGDDLVNVSGQPAAGHRWPADHGKGQLPIDRREHVAIGDQIGAIDDRGKRPLVDVTRLEHFGQLRQPFAHRAGIAQLARRQALAYPQSRGHLGAHRRLGVDGPVLGVRAARQSVTEQLTDRRQRRRSRPILRAPRRTDPIQQGSRFRRAAGVTPLEQLIKTSDHLRR